MGGFLGSAGRAFSGNPTKGLGGLGGLLGGGGGDEEIRHSLFTDEQQKLLSQILGGLGGEGGATEQGLSFLTNLLSGDQGSFERAAAPFTRQFEEQTVPQLASRFAGQDALSSSAFGQALGGAGAGLQENLAALKGQQQQQGLQGLMQLMGIGLTKQFDTEIKQAAPNPLAGILGTVIGGAVGGPAGASIGGSLGQSFGGG